MLSLNRIRRRMNIWRRLVGLGRRFTRLSRRMIGHSWNMKRSCYQRSKDIVKWSFSGRLMLTSMWCRSKILHLMIAASSTMILLKFAQRSCALLRTGMSMKRWPNTLMTWRLSLKVKSLNTLVKCGDRSLSCCTPCHIRCQWMERRWLMIVLRLQRNLMVLSSSLRPW